MHRRFGRPPVCLRSPHRHRRPRGRMMGACQSSGNNEVGDQKKRSQMIDRTLEEDSKTLRRECKILLLGTINTRPTGWRACRWEVGVCA